MGVKDLSGALRRTLPVLAATAVAAVTFASTAAGGIVTQFERLGVRAPGLTAAERSAITLKEISATADPSLGLIVTATFQGNVERYLGQGGLAHGLVALNPDGSKVLVAYNSASTPITFGVASGSSFFSYTILAGAMTTLVWP